MPGVREALYEGEVSPSAVGQLAQAQEAHAEEFSRMEATLVEAARTLPVRDLRRTVSNWRGTVDADAAGRADRERYDRSGLHASPTSEGMVRVDGNLMRRPGRACSARSAP